MNDREVKAPARGGGYMSYCACAAFYSSMSTVLLGRKVLLLLGGHMGSLMSSNIVHGRDPNPQSREAISFVRDR